MLKRLAKFQAAARLFNWLLAMYLRFCFWSGRYRFIGSEHLARFWEHGGAFIFTCWHNRIALMSFINYRPVEVHVLISRHRDGQTISDVVKHFGIKTISGSTDQRHDGRDKGKGGTAAMRHMLRSLKRGITVGITPDGPRGPRMRASDGVAVLAKLSGAPVVPVSVASSNQKVLKSWDRFLFPLPFGRGAFVVGEPIYVPRDADAPAIEAARRRIEDALNEVSAEADRQAGQPPIEPAPLAQAADVPAHDAS